MADDIAKLGIAVDSSQAKSASADLDKLAASAKNAEKAAGDLANAGGKSGNEMRNIEAAAKRAGVSVDEMRQRVEAAAKGGKGLTDNLNAQAGASAAATVAHGALSRGVGLLGVTMSEARVAAGLLASPIGAVVTGTLAIGAGAIYASEHWKSGQRDIERALITIGARSGATIDDINRFADKSASLTGLSVTQARNAAIEFTKTGAVYRDNIGRAVAITDAFSKTMGVDATDGAKTLAKALADPVKGAQELDKELGFLNASTLTTIRTLVSQNDLQGAQRVLIDAITPKIERAAKLTSVWADGWTAVKNASSAALDAVGRPLAPDSREGQINQLKAGIPLGGIGGVEFGGMGLAAEQLKQLQQRTQEAGEQYKKLSVDADTVTRAFVPQIEQIEKVNTALSKLKDYRDALQNNGISVLPQTDAAINAGELQKRMLQESADATDRMNAKTLEIAGNYKGVSAEAALTLDLQKRQLAVAQATTLQERLRAQEALERYQLETKLGPEGAARVAAGDRAQAEAQVRSQLQAQLLAMQDQLVIAQAVTGQQQLAAQADATRNQIIRDTGDAMLATQTAAAQREIAEARINAQIQNQVEGLDQQRRMINAVANGTGAATAAAIAYENAIRAGANETEAAALKSAVLAANMAKVSAASRQASEAMHFASGGSQEFGNQWGDQTVGLPGTSGSDAQRAAWDAAYGAGNYNTFINGGFGISGGRFDVDARPTDAGLQYQYSQTLNNAAMSRMDAETRARFKAGSYKLSQTDAQAIADAFLARGDLAKSANAQKAAADFVNRADSSSSSSSNNSLINPLYTSGSSNIIAFRAATGMDYTVPGTGPTDSVRVSGLVSPGERLIAIPPGGAPPADMRGGGSTSRPAINQRIVIQAASLRGASDTMSQLAARAARAASAAARHR